MYGFNIYLFHMWQLLITKGLFANEKYTEVTWLVKYVHRRDAPDQLRGLF